MSPEMSIAGHLSQISRYIVQQAWSLSSKASVVCEFGALGKISKPCPLII